MTRTLLAEARGRARNRRYVAPPKRKPLKLWLAVVVALMALAPWAYWQWRNALPRVVHALGVVAVDDGGNRLQDVEVEFFTHDKPSGPAIHSARTDASGVARLPASKADGDFYCIGRAKDAVTQTWITQSEPRRMPSLEFAPPETIRGSVVDKRGIPVEGARVEARLAKGPALEVARTGLDGSFELSAVSGILPFLTIHVRRQGYADALREWDRKLNTEPTFELVQTHLVRVRVLLPGGRPHAGARIDVAGRSDLSRLTDRDGFASFAGIHPETSLFLKVEHPRLTFRNDGFRPMAAGQVLQLESPATLTGRVFDREGNSLGNVEVRHRHGPRSWVRARTDSYGRFRIGDLPSGEVELVYELEDGRTGSSFVRLEEGESKNGFVIRAR